MESRIICKIVGTHPEAGDFLQYFGVQPDDKNYPKYFCNVAYLAQQIGVGEKFYDGVGKDKAYLFVNHKPNNGERFVQTKKDGTYTDNLWSLPECSITDYDYIRKETPKVVDPTPIPTPDPIPNPYTFQKLLRYLLPVFGIGFLLPILYCLFFGNCGKPCPDPIPSPKVDTIYVHDTIIKEVPQPCPMYDVLIDSSNVYFKTNMFDTVSFESSAQSLEILKQSTQILLSDTINLYVDLRAYADFRGTVTHNKGLSEKREKSIRKYLLLKGVKPRQIKIQQALGKFYAKEHATPLEQADDRKVEIRIYGLRKIPVVIPPSTKNKN